MELTPRKQAVLRAIVKAYIETGEPIGSKSLADLLENAPSPATLRNEMSELSQLGYLHQPHTSAGRVPTVGGYRLYVDNLFDARVSVEAKEYIDTALSRLNCEPESIPNLAARTLSSLTGLPAIACLMTESFPKIKRIELMPIGKFSLMLLVITDDGRTRNRIFRQTNGITPEAENCFYSIADRKIKGMRVNALTKAYMQSVIAEAGLYSLELMPLLTAVFETASEIENVALTLQGESALYNISASESDARRILSLINRRDPIISILENIDENAGAVFGADTGYSELNTETLIAAKFSVNGKYKGYVGVIGPNRMSYEQIIPATRYTAKKMTEIMTEAQKDMED